MCALDAYLLLSVFPCLILFAFGFILRDFAIDGPELPKSPSQSCDAEKYHFKPAKILPQIFHPMLSFCALLRVPKTPNSRSSFFRILFMGQMTERWPQVYPAIWNKAGGLTHGIFWNCCITLWMHQKHRRSQFA
jgi:hypothetical protein